MPFFPDPVTAWLFVATLAAFLAAASVIDLRTMTVPKWLTLSLLPAGVLFNAVRVALLEYRGLPTWALGHHGVAVAALDGVLFALAGFALGFTLFFVMWILNVVGGGDVKLFAALAAWLGPRLTLWVLVVTLGVTVIAVIAGGMLSMLRGNLRLGRQRRPTAGDGPPKGRLLTFSLPLTLAALAVMAWSFRADLGVAPKPAEQPQGESRAAN